MYTCIPMMPRPFKVIRKNECTLYVYCTYYILMACTRRTTNTQLVVVFVASVYIILYKVKICCLNFGGVLYLSYTYAHTWLINILKLLSITFYHVHYFTSKLLEVKSSFLIHAIRVGIVVLGMFYFVHKPMCLSRIQQFCIWSLLTMLLSSFLLRWQRFKYWRQLNNFTFKYCYAKNIQFCLDLNFKFHK